VRHLLLPRWSKTAAIKGESVETISSFRGLGAPPSDAPARPTLNQDLALMVLSWAGRVVSDVVANLGIGLAPTVLSIERECLGIWTRCLDPRAYHGIGDPELIHSNEVVGLKKKRAPIKSNQPTYRIEIKPMLTTSERRPSPPQTSIVQSLRSATVSIFNGTFLIYSISALA
jgi:hypothetical protein